MRSRSDDDFARAMAGVSPLRPSRRAMVPAPRSGPMPSLRVREEQAALAEPQPSPVEDNFEPGNDLVYLRHGMSPDVLRKLRRGHWVIEDSLDLHGMNRREADVMVTEFLRRCRQRSLRCIRIVHGKGFGSRNREPVLKGKLRGWLTVREDVLAFCQAPGPHGGSGALLILLKA